MRKHYPFACGIVELFRKRKSHFRNLTTEATLPIPDLFPAGFPVLGQTSGVAVEQDKAPGR